MSQIFLEARDGVNGHDDLYASEDLISRFLRHVSISPEAQALVTTEETWTYEHLYQEVLKWKVILSQHVERRAIVFLTRTPRMISILLALQWLRVTYVPVDVDTPIQRLLSIVEESEAETLLHDKVSFSLDSSCMMLNVEHLDHPYTHARHLPVLPCVSDELAYVIYTSGSSGKPKGVAISYRALHHFLACMSRVFLREEGAMVLAVTTIAFDIAQLELWLPLWQNRSIFLATHSQHRDPVLLKNILDEYPITLLQSTPSFWSMLFAIGWKGKAGLVALCGGEALSQSLAMLLLKRVGSLWNMYGPTEATVWCAMKQIFQDAPITVGRPIQDMFFLVLDEAMRPLPPLVKGELYIGGVGLAEGYVNREALNRERFITLNGLRLYRVGDVAMETLSGEFVILGRTDHQIKLHGYRIELEEIEACLKQDVAVSNAVVTVEEEQLVAYLSVSNERYSESDLKKRLKLMLPSYMIPVRYRVLERLPLSFSGKVDRQALPKAATHKVEVVVDATELELALCLMWQIALGCAVTPLDNFFALGGHSLIAARIVAEIGERLGKALTLDVIYNAPTVRELARVIEQASSYTPLSLCLPKFGSWFSLTDYQAMFWLSKRFEPNLKVFNLVTRRRFQERLDPLLLNKALAFVFQKHEVLSYCFHGLYPAQRVELHSPIVWEQRVLSSSDDIEKRLSTSYDDLFYRHQWRAQKPMIVAKSFYLPASKTELQVAISHLIGDERALDIFFEDLCLAYQHYENHGRPPIQKPLPLFSSYAEKEQARFKMKQEEKIAFWKTYLSDSGYLPVPPKYVVSKLTEPFQHYVTEVAFSKELLDFVMTFSAKNQLTLNDVLIATVGLALAKCTEPCDHPVLINAVKSARTEMRFDDVMGCFLEMMVIKFELKPLKTLLDAAKAVQRAWIETFRYQDVPALVKYAAIGRSRSHLGAAKRAMISAFMAFYRQLIQPWIKDQGLLQASARLVQQDRASNFFVSVNVLNSFISPTKLKTEMKEVAVPPHPFAVMPLTSVLDIWFYTEHGALEPKLLVASNLKAEFRERFVNTLLDLLQDAKRVFSTGPVSVPLTR